MTLTGLPRRVLARLRPRASRSSPAEDWATRALAELDRLLGETAAPRIAVLARAGEDGFARDVRRQWRDAAVVELDVRAEPRDQHVTMAAFGSFDAIVDTVVRDAPHRFSRLFLHLSQGGCYLVRVGPRTRETLRDLIGGGREGNDGHDPSAGAEGKRRTDRSTAVGHAAREVRFAPGMASVRNTEHSLAVVRDGEMEAVLGHNPKLGKVLDTVAGASWKVRSRLRTSGPFAANPTPTRYDAPTMYLREYADAICLPRQAAISGNLVLPESFTTVEIGRQRSVAFHKLGTDFVRWPLEERPDPEPLPGRYFHLDTMMIWHFGHVMSEQLSHLWGWRLAKQEDPGLKALVFTESGQLTPWQRDLLTAGGVPETDIHVATSARRVETLVGCTPMFSRHAYLHPQLLETYNQVGAALGERAALPQGFTKWPAKVFFGRRSSKRSCRNAEDLVGEFTRAGFEVVYPEDYPVPTQVELVRRATAVAGFAGSGLFHIALAGEPKHVVVVCSESYPAHNEYMMSALVGHRLDVVLCRAEVPRVEGSFDRQSFHSDYRYDPDREGVFLRSVLSEA